MQSSLLLRHTLCTAGAGGVRAGPVSAACVAVQVWQAILVKKVDLDSKQAQAMMSEGARHLLKVNSPCGQHRMLWVRGLPRDRLKG